MSDSQGKYQIRARREQGFWRAGRHFTKGWETYDRAEFSDAEWEAVTGEPQLVVKPLDGEEESAPAGPAESDAAQGAGDRPALEPSLKDGRPRCQHVFDTGNQCNRAAEEGAAYCEGHLDDHVGEGGE
jgi:hypothetical protein